MDKDTVDKQADKGTSAAIGGITLGSGDTKANETTSVRAPQNIPADFLDQLAEMHTGEKELVIGLALIAKAATSADLKTLLETHLKETEGHVKTLDQIAESLGAKLPVKGCKPITDLILEGKTAIAKGLFGSEQDDALMATGKKIEQVEIDAYTSLVATAKKQNYAHELALLASILVQEKIALELITGLAAGEGPLNPLIEKTVLKHATEPGV